MQVIKVWIIGVIAIPAFALLWSRYNRLSTKRELRYGNRIVLIFGFLWAALWIAGGVSIIVEQGGMQRFKGTPAVLFMILIGIVVFAVIFIKNGTIQIKRFRLLRKGMRYDAQVIAVNYETNISLKYGSGLRFNPFTVTVRYENEHGYIVTAKSNRLYYKLPNTLPNYEALIFVNPMNDKDSYIQVYYISEGKD